MSERLSQATDPMQPTATRDCADDPLAFTIVARQFAGTVVPMFTVRVIGLVVVITVLLQNESAAVAAVLPAVGICMLRIRTAPPAGTAGGTAARTLGTGPAADGTFRAVERSGWWNLIGALDLASALAVVLVSAWATVPQPATARFLAVGSAVLLVSVVCTRVCLDPRWYLPGVLNRDWARWLRRLAGPVGALLCQALVLPAPWGPGERTIVVFLTLLPLAALALTLDQDLTVGCIVEMIRTEAQDGRQSVLDELHGTLSANLRLLEQASLELRASSPRLYELAVGANSRLRETLTLADPLRDSAADPQTLAALVRTLTMAVGAHGELNVKLDRLVDGDRDLVRLVLNDLLRSLLTVGVNRVEVTIEVNLGTLQVVALGDPEPVDQASLAQLLAPLRLRLATVDGSVSVRRRRLVARWPASPGTR